MRPQRPIRGDRGNRDGCSRTRALAVLAGSPVADSGPEMGARRHPDRTNGGRHAWALSLDGPDMSGAGYRSLNEFRSLLKESIRNDDQLHDRCNPDRDGGPMRSDISYRRHTTYAKRAGVATSHKWWRRHCFEWTHSGAIGEVRLPHVRCRFGLCPLKRSGFS
jgi:hypothetical protein